ncbi:MAG: Hcp family type VI secretion system effector [Phycisphaerales bacterium]
MAVDMFMHMGAKIKGEAKDSTHKDEIDVLSWSWGMSQSGTFHTGGGGGAGKVSMQDLTFTKWVDSASHALMLHCSTGDHIPEIKLTVRKAGRNPLEYIIITMKKCMVTSYQTGGSGGEDQLTENVSINFAWVSFDYVKQKDDGSGEAARKFAYDIEANKEA